MAGRNGPVEVDILSWMGRVALELIGQSGLGYSFDPLVADSADELGLAVKRFQYVLRRAYVFVLIVACMQASDDAVEHHSTDLTLLARRRVPLAAPKDCPDGSEQERAGAEEERGPHARACSSHL